MKTEGFKLMGVH